MCIHPTDKSRPLITLSTEVSNFIGKNFKCQSVRLYVVDEDQEKTLFSKYAYSQDGSQNSNTNLETNDDSFWSVVRSNEATSGAFLDGKSDTTYVILQPVSLNPQKTVGVLEVKRKEALSPEDSKLLEQMCNMIAPKVYICYFDERQKVER